MGLGHLSSGIIFNCPSTDKQDLCNVPAITAVVQQHIPRSVMTGNVRYPDATPNIAWDIISSIRCHWSDSALT